ncbi:hypothetical protein [Rurimicrobium arvi]|uniref:DUF5362 family protein n=1 Tax=Rurimicrobium arvi TaxID=2049916 RepID=A0ABP8MTI9_9BACT
MHTGEDIIFGDKLTEQGKRYLQETARWTRFLAIIGFVAIGFMALAMLAFVLTGATKQLFSKDEALSVSLLTGLIALVFMISVYWYPTLMLFRFSKYIKAGIADSNPGQLELAFRCQRNFFKFCGIIILIFLVLYALVFSIGAFATSF